MAGIGIHETGSDNASMWVNLLAWHSRTASEFMCFYALYKDKTSQKRQKIVELCVRNLMLTMIEQLHAGRGYLRKVQTEKLGIETAALIEGVTVF